MKKFTKLVSLLLILSLVIPGFVFATDLSSSQEEMKNISKIDNSMIEKVVGIIDKQNKSNKFNNEESKYEEDDVVRVIVELEDESVIAYATNSGSRYDELSSSTITTLERKLLARQSKVKSTIQKENIDIEYLRSFTTVFNGFSGEVEFKEIDTIESLPGVKSVYISNEYERPIVEPDMNTSKDMIGTNPTWETGYKGEGMVVAVIDTGIDPSHNDMVLSEETQVKLSRKMIDNLGLDGRYFTAKVPYGYNYYDLNDTILDLGPTASEHGMHVAGTVGANGDPENGGIKGVAPEAQLLAMKVFSNDPIYSTTYGDIYLAAIEDAIKLKADVLNMSLGSTAGFYDPESAENKAITNAVENGIVCAISAGNSGQITYGWTESNYGFPLQKNPDIGVVGSPGLSKDSLQVASLENTHLMSAYLTYKGIDSVDVLPMNTVIVEDNAYDIKYLNSNSEAQNHLINNYNNNKAIYIKLGSDTIVDIKGVQVEATQLPEVVMYYDGEGNTAERSPIESGQAGEEVDKKVPMTIAGEVHPATVFEGQVEFVDCGLGKAEDFEGKELTGKIAVIMRGSLTFVEKIENAQKAKAAGVIVYNNAGGGEELINMAYPAKGTIPAVFIGNKGGVSLLALENKVVTFSDEEIQTINQNAGLMSEFTSWGTTPSLELKPEITAPGGKIYSTLQNNRYGTMSGTSMSSPHVAGGSALVMQYIKGHEKYKALTPEQQARLAKVLMMNTAEIVMNPDFNEEDQIVSPRVQGAGLMNLNAAINTPVRVVNSATNEGKVELKDFESTSFEMTLKAINDGNKDVTYKVGTEVLTDMVYQGLNLLCAREMDAEIVAPETITVPANGEKEFIVKVDFGKDADIYRNMFVEGFVTLEDVIDEVPTLSVPYVGFYGDWTEPKILDGMNEIDDESYFGYSGIVNEGGSLVGQFYETVPALSPTADGRFIGTSRIIPIISFLRNVREMQINILDENKDKVATLRNEEYLRKSYYDGGNRAPYSYSPARGWDGSIGGETVKDGLYYYEIKTKIDYENAEWEVKQIPVFVDAVAPEVSDIKYDRITGILSWKATDETSGVERHLIAVNEEMIEDELNITKNKETGEYEFNIKPYLSGEGMDNIQVFPVDYAFNIGWGTTDVSSDDEQALIWLESPELFDIFNKQEVDFNGFVIKDGELTNLTINGEEVEATPTEKNIVLRDQEGNIIVDCPGYEFSTTLSFENGVQVVQVEATFKSGSVVSITRSFYVDTENPVLVANVVERESTSETATIEVQMSDNFPELKLYVNGSEEFHFDGFERETVIEPANKTTTLNVPLEIGENTVKLVLMDAAGNKVEQILTIERTAE